MLDLIRSLPSDVARFELGPRLSSKDLARLCLAEKDCGCLIRLGRAPCRTHYADGPLDESDLAAFAAARVWVQPFSGVIRVPVSSEELTKHFRNARYWLKKQLVGSLHPSKLLPLPEETTIATCRLRDGKLHGDSYHLAKAQAARILFVGRGISLRGEKWYLQRLEFWCHGYLARVQMRFVKKDACGAVGKCS